MTTLQIRNCEFAFRCNAKWEDLSPTGRANIRFCNECEKDVRRCETDEELIKAIRSNLCVAISAPYPDASSETEGVWIGSMRARPMPSSENDVMPTLKYVMSMTEYEWSIWVKNQTPAVIEHLKKLVSLAPPNAVRARQIKAL